MSRHLLATAIIIGVIVYGSLYPFSFRPPAGGIGPLDTLFSSWAAAPRRADFAANMLFYLPLGLFAALAVAGKTRALVRIFLVAGGGALLSIAMELAQYYIPERVTAAADVYANVIGAALGAVAASVWSGNFRWPLLGAGGPNRAACLLLALWLGYRLFPYVPTIDLHKYWNALKSVVLYPSMTGYGLFRYTAIWLTIGALIEAIGGGHASLLFALFIGAVLTAKVAIVGKALTAAEIAGAGLAFVLWPFLAACVGARGRTWLIALLFCVSIVAERLAPFQFAAHGRPFGWVPFLAFLHGSLEVNILSFFEKAFLYGSLIWLLGRAGLRLGISVFFVAALLFVTSWAQVYLPGRSAEITDAVMALLIGAIIALIEGEPTRAHAKAVAGR